MASVKYSWSSSEDSALIDLVHQNGAKKWCKISILLNEIFTDSGKTGKQCRERWHNHLNPKLNKNSFSLEDEIKVFELQKQFGNKWSLIAENFQGRNDNFIKNCFYSAIRRNLRKYNKKKVPSKQLKGTISDLMKNAHSRKILMHFPEHEAAGIARLKLNPIEEELQTPTFKEKEKIIKPEKSVIKKNPPCKIDTSRSCSSCVNELENINTATSSNMTLRRKVPSRIDTSVKGGGIIMGYSKNIDDITPTMYTQMSLGIMTDEDMSLDSEAATTPLSELCRFELSKADSSSNHSFILPDYNVQSNFQHYDSPRN